MRTPSQTSKPMAKSDRTDFITGLVILAALPWVVSASVSYIKFAWQSIP